MSSQTANESYVNGDNSIPVKGNNTKRPPKKSGKSIGQRKRALGDITNASIRKRQQKGACGELFYRKEIPPISKIQTSIIKLPVIADPISSPIQNKKALPNLKSSQISYFEKNAGIEQKKETEYHQTFEVTAHSITNIELLDKASSVNCIPYSNFIHQNLLLREQLFSSKLSVLRVNSEVNERMRAVLIDWLVDVHMKYRLHSETLFLCVSLLDRTLSTKELSITRKTLQLIGMVCLWIASKFEDMIPPDLSDLTYVCDGAYEKKDIMIAEMAILNNVNFEVNVPIALTFLKRGIKAITHICAIKYVHFKSEISYISSLSRFLVELSWLDSCFFRFKPSTMACSALRLAVKIFRAIYNEYPEILEKETDKKDIAVDLSFEITINSFNIWDPILDWNTSMQLYMGCDRKEMRECSSLLRDTLLKTNEKKSGYIQKLSAIKRKFSQEKYNEVSLRLPDIIRALNRK